MAGAWHHEMLSADKLLSVLSINHNRCIIMGAFLLLLLSIHLIHGDVTRHIPSRPDVAKSNRP
jgi:small neutral amino acid transporter SnatA (MarC family)